MARLREISDLGWFRSRAGPRQCVTQRHGIQEVVADLFIAEGQYRHQRVISVAPSRIAIDVSYDKRKLQRFLKFCKRFDHIRAKVTVFSDV